MRLRIEPHTERFGHIVKGWIAFLDYDNGSPAFDGIGETVERALAALAMQVGEYVERRERPPGVPESDPEA